MPSLGHFAEERPRATWLATKEAECQHFEFYKLVAKKQGASLQDVAMILARLSD